MENRGKWKRERRWRRRREGRELVEVEIKEDGDEERMKSQSSLWRRRKWGDWIKKKEGKEEN